MPPKIRKQQTQDFTPGSINIEELLFEVLSIGASAESSGYKQLPIDAIEAGRAFKVQPSEGKKSFADVLPCVSTNVHALLAPWRLPNRRAVDSLESNGDIPTQAFWLGRVIDVDLRNRQIFLPGEASIRIVRSLRSTAALETEAMIALIEVIFMPDGSSYGYRDAIYHAVPTPTRWWP